MQNGSITTIIDQAADVHTPLDQLEELSKNSYFAVREAVANNPNFGKLSEETQKRLLTEDLEGAKSRFVNCAAAKNPGLSPSLFETAFMRKEVRVRAAFAENTTESSLYLEFLSMLLVDQAEEVRISASKNKSVGRLTEDMLEKYGFFVALGKEKSMFVLEALANNKLPVEAYKIIEIKGKEILKERNDSAILAFLLANKYVPDSIKESCKVKKHRITI